MQIDPMQSDEKGGEDACKHILVTGGAGYIGSHTVAVLLEEGYHVTVADSTITSSPVSLDRVHKVTGKKPAFRQLDLCDARAVDHLFKEAADRGTMFDAVIHLAGLKAVGESVASPLAYYRNNLVGTLNLLAAMERHKVSRLVFSSSATVYGERSGPSEGPKPYVETDPLQPTNPYGRTKLQIEDILRDMAAAKDSPWKFVILRYFNPVGAHPSGEMGEDPVSPNNLAPYIAQVAVGRRECLMIYGEDYKTVDGSGVRDYIHVMDLARAHSLALSSAGGVFNIAERSCEAYNVGTGQGVSVKQMIAHFSKAVGRPIPSKVVERRPGDVATAVADPTKAKDRLGFKTALSIEQAAADTIRWQTRNPDGYRSTNPL